MLPIITKFVSHSANLGLMIAVALLIVVIAIQILTWRKLDSARVIYRLASISRKAVGIRTFGRSLRRLALELESARRYQRPLSIAVLTISSEESLDASGAMRWLRSGNGKLRFAPSPDQAIHLVLPFVGSVLQDSLRGTDKVTFNPAKSEFVIMLTQSKKAEAQTAIARLKTALATKSNIRLESGLAEFPADGLILPDLVEAARACTQEAKERVFGELAAGRSFGENLPAKDVVNS